MAATITRQMTVEEFRSLPETGPFYYELRNGELVKVTRPKMKHQRLQRKLRILLEAAAGQMGVVECEVAFRALADFDLRVADVAYVNRERWESVDDEDNLHGAPDLVVEILSPSNTVSEILDKEKLCLENGCSEFWLVDGDRRQIKVSTPDGITTTYRSGQEIPLRVFGGGSLKVDAVFA
ncbi:MAG TPA: Uma2 family endonuclease [Bryobacteraceae bacterium]|jgi:Uma2 family endonuclease